MGFVKNLVSIALLGYALFALPAVSLGQEIGAKEGDTIEADVRGKNDRVKVTASKYEEAELFPAFSELEKHQLANQFSHIEQDGSTIQAVLDSKLWEGENRWFLSQFHHSSNRLKGIYQQGNLEQTAIDAELLRGPLLAASGYALKGSIYVNFPESRKRCGNKATIATNFNATISLNLDSFSGSYEQLKIDRDTCEIFNTGKSIKFTFSATTPTWAECITTEDVGLGSVIESVKKLEKSIKNITQKNYGIPKTSLFWRKNLRGEEKKEAEKFRPIVAEQIRNRGIDDWTLENAKEGGNLALFIPEIRSQINNKKQCSTRQELAKLANTLERIKTKFDKRRNYIISHFKAIHANHINFARRIADILDTRTENTIVSNFAVEKFGINKKKYTNVTTWGGKFIFWINEVIGYGLKYGINWGNPKPKVGKFGFLSALYDSYRVVIGFMDISDIIDARKQILPFYLEMAELNAWLQPLVDGYNDLDTDMQIIIEKIRP